MLAQDYAVTSRLSYPHRAPDSSEYTGIIHVSLFLGRSFVYVHSKEKQVAALSSGQATAHGLAVEEQVFSLLLH